LKQAFNEAVQACIRKYEEMSKNEVKVAFDKYDTDGSGAIDKEELAALSKELGHELTEE
jgi:Ca2+-binding EF-hand superfamily protein